MGGKGPLPGHGGGPRKPIEIKRLLGNPGKRPLPKPITALVPFSVAAVTVPHDGRALVQALLDAGAGAWIGVTDQLGTLELLVEAWDERARLRADILVHGYSNDGGFERPESKRLGVVERQITQWLSLLGLTPSDRSRLGVAEVKARTKLEELRSRRGTRDGRHVG